MTKEMSSLAALLLPLLPLLLVLLLLSCEARDAHLQCPSRVCGRHNISHPFRLQDSPPHCGNPTYTLSCEGDRLLLYRKSGKFNVQSINYNNYTIRLADANINELHTHDYFSLPPYSLALDDFSREDPYQYQFYRPGRSFVKLVKQMLYLRCPYQYPMESSDPYADDSRTATCINGSFAAGSAFYVTDLNESLWDLGLGDSCRIEWMYLTSRPVDTPETIHTNIISCTDIHNMLLYGFEVSWAISSCKHYNHRWYFVDYATLDDHNEVTCYEYPFWGGNSN